MAVDREVAKAHVTLSARERELEKAFDRIEKRQDAAAAAAARTNKGMRSEYNRTIKEVDRLGDSLDRNRRTVERLGKEGKVSLRVEQKTLKDLDDLERRLDRMDGRDIHVSGTILGDMEAKLLALDRMVTRVDGRQIRIGTDLDAAGTLLELELLEKKVDELDGRRIEFTISEKTRSSIGSAGLIFDIIRLKLTLMFAKLPPLIALMGQADTGLFALVSTATQLIAPLTSVVGEVGNLGGALLTAAPAATTLHAAIVTLATAFGPLAYVLKENVKEANKVAQSFLEASRSTDPNAMASAERAYEKLSGTQKEFVPIQLQMNRELLKFQEYLSKPALRVWTSLLTAAFGTLNNVKSGLRESADEVAGLSEEFEDLVGTSRFQSFFQQLVKMGGYMVKQLGPSVLRLADSFRAIFVATLPNVKRFTDSVSDLLDEFSDLVLKSERSGKLQEVFDDAWDAASKLASIVGNVGHALFTWFSSSKEAGMGLLDTLDELTERFDNWMTDLSESGDLKKFAQESSDSFNGVIELLWQMSRVLGGILKAALPGGNSLIQELTGWFEDLADSINSLEGQKGIQDFFERMAPVSKLLGETLQIVAVGMFEVAEASRGNLVNALKGLNTELLPKLIEVFKIIQENIGPVLNEILIEKLTAILTIMGDAQGPVHLFLVLLREVLGAFELLPHPVQLVVANFIALQTILRVFFDTKLLTLLSGALEDIWLYFKRVAVASKDAGIGVALFGTASEGLGATPFGKGFKARRATTVAEKAGGGFQTAEQLALLGGGSLVAEKATTKWGKLGEVLANVVGWLGKAGRALKSPTVLFSRFGTVIAGAATAIATFVGEISGLTAAGVSLTGVGAIIIAVIAAITGAVVALATNFGNIRGIIVDMLEWAVEPFIDGFEEIKKVFVEFVEALTGGHAQEAAEGASSAISKLGDAFAWLSDKILPAIKLVAQVVGFGVLIAIFAPLAVGIRAIGYAFQIALVPLKLFIKSLTFLVEMARKVPQLFGAIESGLDSIPGLLEKALNGLKALPGLALDALKKLPYVIGLVIGNSIKAFIVLTITLPILATKALVSVVKIFFSTLKKAIPAVVDFVSSVVSWFRKLPGKLVDAVKDAVNAVKNYFVSSKGGGRKSVESFMSGALAFLASLPAKFWNWAKRAVRRFVEALLNSAKSVWHAMTVIGDEIIDFLKTLPDKVYNAAKDIGKEIADGIKDGIGDISNLIPDINVGLPSIGLATGGPVPGFGRGDKTDAKLEAGEYVIKRDKVKQYGRGFFDAINFGRSKIRPAISNMYQSGGEARGGGISIGPGLQNLAGSVGSLSSTVKGSLLEIEALVNKVFTAYEETIKKHAKAAADAAVKEAERTRDQVKKKLEEAKQAAKSETEKMADSGRANFKKLSDASVFHFDKTKETATKKTNQTKTNVVDAVGKLAGKWLDNMTGMKDATKVSFESILGQTSTILKAFGVDFKIPAISAETHSDKYSGKQSQSGDAKHHPQFNAKGGRAEKHPWRTFFAEGGRVMGDMIGTLRDVVPAMLGKNEVVLNPHQESFIEGMSGIPGIVDMALGAVQTPNYYPFAKGGRGDKPQKSYKTGWAGIGPSGLQEGIRKVTAAVIGAFPGLQVTSTTGGTHATGSYHYSGEATDISGSTDEMFKASEWIKKTGIYKALAEGIHNPNLSISDGSQVSPSYYSGVWADHANHIHLAVTQAVKNLAGFAGSALGGIAGSVPKIKMPKINAKGGAAGAIAKLAVNKVGNAANKFIAQKAAATGGLAPVMGGSGGSVEAQIYRTLRKNGLNLVGASGIIGNAYAESSLNPLAEGYGGGGLWGFTSPPISWQNVKEFAAKRGLPLGSAPMQTVFMLKHLAQSLRNRLNASASPEAAASLFMSEWERPGIPRQDVREAGARRAFNRFSKGAGSFGTKVAKGGRVLANAIKRPFARYATGKSSGAASGGTSAKPPSKERNRVQKEKERLEKELDKLIERIENQFKGRFEQLGQTLIGLIKQITDDEIKDLVAEFRRIQKKIKANFKDAFQDLAKYTGKSLEFTKENIRGIAQVVAAIKTFRGLAHRKAPDMDQIRKEYEEGLDDKELKKFQKKSAKEQQEILKKELEDARDAFTKMREAAKEALKGARESLKNIVETIVSSSTEIYEAFNSYLEAGSNLSSSITSPAATTFDALQGLDKLDFSKIEGFLGRFSYYAKTIKDFGRQMLFAKQQVNLGIRELRDLGAQMSFIQKLAKKTGSNFKGSIEQVKQNVLATAQSAIDAINRMYEAAKAELDRQLSSETDAIERAREAEITGLEKARDTELKELEKSHDQQLKDLEKAHEDKLKAIEGAEKDITRAQEREQRRREQALTRRSLGKLLAQEFLSEEDISQIESLQAQLAEQLRGNAEAERRYLYEDTLDKINEDYDQTVEQINTDYEKTREGLEEKYTLAIEASNKRFDQAIEEAQEKYAQAIVALTNQTQAMMDNVVKEAAKALGIKPAQFWDYLLGGGTIQRKVGKDAASELVAGLLENPNLFIQAGAEAMRQFLAGANAAAAGQNPPTVAVSGAQALPNPKPPKPDNAPQGKHWEWNGSHWHLVGNKKSHSGGYVPGYYKQETDRTLEAGEYVMRQPAVAAFGRNFFDLLNIAAPTVASPVAFSTPGAGGGPTPTTQEMLHRFAIEVRATGLSKEAEMALVEKTSIEIAKQGRLQGSTAIGQPARFPIG